MPELDRLRIRLDDYFSIHKKMPKSIRVSREDYSKLRALNEPLSYGIAYGYTAVYFYTQYGQTKIECGPDPKLDIFNELGD